MNPWRRFVRWLARKEIAAERARLRQWSTLLGVPSGSSLSLAANLEAACRNSIPVFTRWRIEQRENADLEPGELRIMVEQPPVVPRRVA